MCWHVTDSLYQQMTRLIGIYRKWENIHSMHSRYWTKKDKDCLHFCFSRRWCRLCARRRRRWQMRRWGLVLWPYTCLPSGGRFLQGTPKQRQTSDKTEGELKGISMPLLHLFFSNTTWILIPWKAQQRLRQSVFQIKVHITVQSTWTMCLLAHLSSTQLALKLE